MEICLRVLQALLAAVFLGAGLVKATQVRRSTG